MAKHLAGPRWKSLSIGRGESRAWNEAMRRKAEQRT
ncbi:MAG TPA: hypothetical protein VN971_09780 [Thermoanaerobaculia bacterium]|nr:hypothetical protein [Thermoanaerobaculia bacterium]